MKGGRRVGLLGRAVDSTGEEEVVDSVVVDSVVVDSVVEDEVVGIVVTATVVISFCSAGSLIFTQVNKVHVSREVLAIGHCRTHFWLRSQSSIW